VSIFADNAPRYFAAGLNVIPLYEKEKKPILMDWSRFAETPVPPDLQKQWIAQYPNSNLGLALGPVSGVIVIDIDTDNSDFMKAIVKLLPPSPWSRKGKKGMMLAYKYSAIKTHRIKNISGETIVECLSARTQCVLPPSIHPDTKLPYESNTNLYDVLDKLVCLPDDIEDQLRTALAAAGVQLSHSGWSRVTEYVSSGSRDTTLTELAGLFAYAVVRGERTLKEAIGMLRAYHAEYIENSTGDKVDVDKHISNLVRFLHRDVLDKGKVLPKGWDAELTDAEKTQLCLTLGVEHTEWTFEEIQNYLKEQFQTHASGKPRADAVEAILYRISKSRQLSRIDEDRLLKYIVDVSGLGVPMATYRARLRELRSGDVAGNDHSEIARAVIKDLEQYNLIRYVGEKFMKWAGSHWVELRKSDIRHLISSSYGHLNACKKSSDINGVLNVVAFLCEQTILKKPVKGINFANGFLTEELKLVPHDPDYGMVYTLPFRYLEDQAGKFPKFAQFMARSWDRDSDYHEKMVCLQEVMSVVLFGLGSKFQRAVLLHGAPASGKTQLLRMIEMLVPPEGKCSVPPEEWGDKFLPTAMHLKVLNICGELSDKKRIDGQKFKDIIDGSAMSGQFKGQQVFSFKPELTHLFASNHLPKTDDTSGGFTRRWVFLTFHYPVKDCDKVLDLGDIIAAEEREAIAAWCVQAMPALMQRSSYTLPMSHHLLTAEFANINNSVRLWLLEAGKIKFNVEGGFVQETRAYNSYYAFCAGAGGAKPVGLPKFRAMLRELSTEIGFKMRVTQSAMGGTDCVIDGVSMV
jgi:phage/plasmid-associated DNA primase